MRGRVVAVVAAQVPLVQISVSVGSPRSVAVEGPLNQSEYGYQYRGFLENCFALSSTNSTMKRGNQMEFDEIDGQGC